MLVLLIGFVLGVVAHHYVGQKIEDKLKGMIDGVKGMF